MTTMATKYRFTYRPDAATQLVGNIDVAGYSGPVIELRMSDFALDYHGGITDIAATSTCSLSVMRTERAQFYELFHLHPRDVSMTLLRNGAAYWKGYYDVELYEEELADGTCELSFSCGLNRLQDELWEVEGVWVSHREALRRCLAYWGETHVDVYCDMSPEDAVAYVPHEVICREMVHDAAYAGKSYKAVMESICGLYGLRIARVGDVLRMYPAHGDAQSIDVARLPLSGAPTAHVSSEIRSMFLGMPGMELAGELKMKGGLRRSCAHGVKRLAVERGTGQYMPLIRETGTGNAEGWAGPWKPDEGGIRGTWVPTLVQNPSNPSDTHRPAFPSERNGKFSMCFPGQPRFFPPGVNIYPFSIYRTYVECPSVSKVEFRYTFSIQAKPFSEIGTVPNPNLPKVLSHAMFIRITDVDTGNVAFLSLNGKRFSAAALNAGPYDQYGAVGDRTSYEIFDAKEAGSYTKEYTYSIDLSDMEGIYRNPFDTAYAGRREVLVGFFAPNAWKSENGEMTQAHYEQFDYHYYGVQLSLQTAEGDRSVTYESDGIGREEIERSMAAFDGLHAGYAGQVLTGDMYATSTPVAYPVMVRQRAKVYLYFQNGQPVWLLPDSRVRHVALRMMRYYSDVRETWVVELRHVAGVRMGDIVIMRGEHVGDAAFWVECSVAGLKMTATGMRLTLTRISSTDHAFVPAS